MPDTADYPITKFGARWVCDGPTGRFHAATKGEAERLLDQALGLCDGGWVIVNPDWPSGDDVYRERCPGCERCDP